MFNDSRDPARQTGIKSELEEAHEEESDTPERKNKICP